MGFWNMGDDTKKPKEEDMKEARKKKNQDLVDRMKRGEALNLYSPQDTFFPPRPIIQKDKKLMRKLFDVSSSGGQKDEDS